jgi:hypothetical protein
MRNTVPTILTPGESLTWEKSFADYPASDGWELVYYFRGAGAGFDVAATADGDTFELAVAAEDTEELIAGRYYYQAFVELETERLLVDEGEIMVRASLSEIQSADTFDGRSQVKIILDAVDALIAGKATLDQQEYSIGTRQLKRYPLPDLIALRDKYAKLYAAELRAERLKNGGSLIRNHKVRFRNPK